MGQPEKKRGEAFWEMFKLSRDGRLKSTFLLYAFALSFVYVAVYLVAYILLLEPIDSLLPAEMPRTLVNLIESVLPALVATGLCMLPFHTIQDKRIVPGAFAFVLLYALAVLIAIPFSFEDAGDRASFLRLYALFVPVPVLMGCLASALAYVRAMRKRRRA